MSSEGASGGCRCGRVRAVVTGPALISFACHCRECQRMTGGAYSLSSLYPRAALRLTDGEDQLVLGGTQLEHEHWHCAHCKSWLYTVPKGMSEVVNVRQPFFDTPDARPPFLDVYRGEGAAWVKSGAAHRYDTLPDDEAWPGLMQAFAARA